MNTLIRVSVVLVATFLASAWVWGGLSPAAEPRAAAPVGVFKLVRPVSILTTPERGPMLPGRTRHGLLMRLQQYPDLALATAAQRARARVLLDKLYATAARWSDPRAAEAAGFDVRRPHRVAGDARVMWFHSENRAWHSDDRYLDPSRPDTLIYADVPHHSLIVVGVMISMPRGMRGPTPGGPITRWHSHVVCVSGDERGLAPRRDGSCPAGARIAQGSEMMHVWFTRDLRSAFAVHAPGPELCSSRLLPSSVCRNPGAFHVM